MAKPKRNPFDQFDDLAADPTSTEGVPQPSAMDSTYDPAKPLEVVMAADPNTFDAPDAALAKPLSNDQIDAEIIRRLDAGDDEQDIRAWGLSVGRKIFNNENWVANLAARDARRAGQKVAYKPIQILDPEEAPPLDMVGGMGAMVRQGTNTVLLNAGDEIAAGVGSLAPGAPGYEELWEQYNRQNDADWETHPVTSGVGVGIGAVGAGVTMPSMLGLSRVKEAGKIAPHLLEAATKGEKFVAATKGLATRAAVGSAEGAAYGAAVGTGEGTPDDRFKNTAAGTAIGAGIGVVAAPFIEGGARIVRPIRERLFKNPERALADRAGLSQEQIAASRGELARQEALGLDPTTLDVLPEPGRNVIGSAGRHDAARADLQDFAHARSVQLPERVQGQADTVLLPTKEANEVVEHAPVPAKDAVIEDPVPGSGYDQFMADTDDLAYGSEGDQINNLLVGKEFDSDPDLIKYVAAQGFTKSDWDDYVEKYALHDGTQNTTQFKQELKDSWQIGPGPAPGANDGAPPIYDDLDETIAPDPAVTPPAAAAGYDESLLRSPTAMKEELDATRSADLDARMEPIRHSPVEMTDEVADILATGQGQAAIREAIDMEADPVLRDQLMRLGSAVQQLAKIDPRLPANARAQIVKQIVAQAPFTINASEKISRALSNKAATAGAPSGVLNTFSKTVRDAARTNPDFVAAMQAASAQHKAVEAVELGEGFLSTSNSDDFVRGANSLPDTPTATLRIPEDPEAAKIDYSDPEMHHALDVWQGSGAYRITKALDQGGTLAPDDAKTLAVVTRLINSSKVGPEQLFRGLGAGNMTEITDILQRGNRGPKSHTTYLPTAKGFAGGPDSGVVTDFDYAGRGLDLRDIPASPNAEPHYTRGSEKEVILPPGRFVGPDGRSLTEEQLMALPRGSDPNYPQYKQAPIARGRYIADPLLPPTATAPSNRELARVGAAGAVRDKAGQGPSEARGVAERFYDSPEQARRTEALVGPEKTKNLGERMRGEVERVYRAARQATKEGPAPEGSIGAVEGTANALYNPGPISILRESARFLHKIGMTEKDAKWIVAAATDPAQTGKMLDRLEKIGMDKLRAQAFVEELRNAAVVYSTSSEEN